jgi:formamidopyrimidine-DNA glycosylase
VPELAEVDFFRRRWDAGLGAVVKRVETHPAARVFRGCDVAALTRRLRAARLTTSHAHGKQMLFGFSRGAWLGVHLGMTGELRVEPPSYRSTKHDHLMLRQSEHTLVFADARMFGRIRFDLSAPGPPAWWRELPPAVLSKESTVHRLTDQLRRRTKSPIKAVLLDQRTFPGIGNWMADEILWRVRLHPLTSAGKLSDPQIRRLWTTVRWVARRALDIIGPDWDDLPSSWLFQHRWGVDRKCPRCGAALVRVAAAGRTTCYCPKCQPAPSRAVGRRPVRTGHRRERPGSQTD